VLAEPHNTSDGWQGKFRRGHPDAVLLRYARSLNGNLDGLLLSHLDVFARGVSLRWCEAYEEAGGNRLHNLPQGLSPDLARQESLTRRLLDVVPQYAPEAVTDAATCMARMAAELQCPVWFGAAGNTHVQVKSCS
jgi:adenylosuccinate synthase